MLSVLRDGKLITEKKKSSETLTERFRELAVICFNRLWAIGLRSAYIPEPLKESLELRNDGFFLRLAVSTSEA